MCSLPGSLSGCHSGTQSQGAVPEFLALLALKTVWPSGQPQALCCSHNGAIVPARFPLGLCPCTCWYNRVQLFLGTQNSGSLCVRSWSTKTEHSSSVQTLTCFQRKERQPLMLFAPLVNKITHKTHRMEPPEVHNHWEACIAVLNTH